MNTFTNNPALEFRDITTELYRTYKFPGNEFVTIENPIAINVSKSGGHRIVDNQGKSHYIPAGYLAITWKVKDGQPNFVF